MIIISILILIFSILYYFIDFPTNPIYYKLPPLLKEDFSLNLNARFSKFKCPNIIGAESFVELNGFIYSGIYNGVRINF